MTEKTKFHIFFSWQSDSPRKTNHGAIGRALHIACERLGTSHPGLTLVSDEATRGTSGSPLIVGKILEKIEAADMFVADITTVTPPGADRPCPNPNVLFELGYAVATLGWERIVLLFNGAVGAFPSDLPFDLAGNRANRYDLALGDPTAQVDKLHKLVEIAVRAVVDKNPKRPAELKGLSRERIEHDRDVENMRWLMETLHLPTLKQHIDDLPKQVSDRAMWFYEHFRGVADNPLFKVYDPALDDAVALLLRAWGSALAHGMQYTATSDERYVFANQGGAQFSQDRQIAWDAIEAARAEMDVAFSTIIERIRSTYLEIDIQRTSERAWRGYLDFHRQFEADQEKRSPV